VREREGRGEGVKVGEARRRETGWKGEGGVYER
jgi:hypothetical protein